MVRRFLALAALAVASAAGFANAAGVYNVSTLSNVSGGFGYDPDKPAPTVTTDGFHAAGGVSDYNSVRFTPAAIGMPGLTLGDIVGIAYDHKQAGGGDDWQLKVYTVGDSTNWYGYRLNYDLSAADPTGAWSTFTDTNGDAERINTKPNAATPTYRLNNPSGFAAEVAAASNQQVLFFDISAGAQTGGYAYDTYLNNITIDAGQRFGTSTIVGTPVPLPASAWGGMALMGLLLGAKAVSRRPQTA